MASRRGMSNQDRLALDAATTSASSTIKGFPLYLFDVFVALNDTNATGDLVLADTSASAVADVTAGDFLGIRLGGGASGGTTLNHHFEPPVYVAVGLVCSATNCEVSVTYLSAN